MRSAPAGIANGERGNRAPYPSRYGAPMNPVVPLKVVELRRVCHSAEMDPVAVRFAAIVNVARAEPPGRTVPANQLVSSIGPSRGETPTCLPYKTDAVAPADAIRGAISSPAAGVV